MSVWLAIMESDSKQALHSMGKSPPARSGGWFTVRVTVIETGCPLDFAEMGGD